MRPRALLGVALAAFVAVRTTPASDLVDAPSLDFRQIVKDAKDRVFPSLVFVRCVREDRERGRREGRVVSGSGVLISSAGELLTNWHVVDRAREVRCMLHDGAAFPAKVLGSDKDTDLALLKLEAPPGTPPFPAATLGDSDALVEGDFVMAMGAPWGMSRSVSIGIVACTRRYLVGSSEYSLWIQTDASISAGNSGGPLLNTRGEIVGLNARVMRSGELGFAIPASTIQVIARQIRESGRVAWTWTGLRLQPLRDFDRDTYFEGRAGAVVAGADPDSPARAAGFETHDRLLSVNGSPVNVLTTEDLPAAQRLLGTLPLGRPATMRVRRGRAELDLTMLPREKGAVEGDELDCPRWDLSVKTINRFEHPELHFYRQDGVFVLGVRTPGNASVAGLRRSDILLKVGRTDIRTLADVRAALEATVAGADTESRVLMTILRDGLLRQVVLDISRNFERE